MDNKIPVPNVVLYEVKERFNITEDMVVFKGERIMLEFYPDGYYNGYPLFRNHDVCLEDFDRFLEKVKDINYTDMWRIEEG